MPDALETLDRCELFASLTPKARAAAAAEMRERRFAAGEVMSSEDRGGVGFFVIAEGTAEVTVAATGWSRTLGAGDCFGEMALITGQTRSAGIVAATEVQCWVLSQWHFKPLVMENPGLAWALLEVLAHRVRETQLAS